MNERRIEELEPSVVVLMAVYGCALVSALAVLLWR